MADGLCTFEELEPGLYGCTRQGCKLGPVKTTALPIRRECGCRAARRARRKLYGEAPAPCTGCGREKREPELPSLVAQAGNVLAAAGRVAGAFFRGGQLIRPAEQVEAVLAICASNACGLYLASEGRCAKCGCFVAVKAELATERCPEGHW